MGSRTWTGYGPEDADDFSGLGQAHMDPSDASLGPTPHLTDAGPRLSVGLPPPKSVSLDAPKASTKTWPPLPPAPRHYTYPLPQAEREFIWMQSNPGSREASHASSHAPSDAQPMLSAFDTSLSGAPGQDRSFGSASQAMASMDCETPSPRLAWERGWPNVPQTLTMTQAPDLSSATPMVPSGQPMRLPPSTINPMYASNDLRWPEASQMGPGATVPSGPIRIHPNVLEGAQAPGPGAWNNRMPLPRGRADTVSPHHDRHNQEISTLFIAGFPDDITEREFANIFLFSKGFEASMLKYPTPPHPRGGDDAHDKGHHGEQHDKDTPGPESTGSRNKQIIGFAKFYTREEAFEAREVLNGFRIDPERGCILKAELAKKNLHTKRSAPCVINKHQATNAHGVASRGVVHETPLSMTDPHTAYAMAMLNAGIPSTQTKHFPTPLNMAAMTDNSRDIISPALPQSAPPRMDTVLPNLGAWTMPSNSFDMSMGERGSYVGSPNLTRGPAVLDAPRGLNKIVPSGYDSLPKRPDVSVRQASLGEPRRLSTDARVAFRDAGAGEPLTSFDPAASLGRLQLGRDSPVPERPEVKERGELSIPTPRTDTGDAALNSLLNSFPQRRSPVSIYTPSTQSEGRSREAPEMESSYFDRPAESQDPGSSPGAMRSEDALGAPTSL